MSEFRRPDGRAFSQAGGGTTDTSYLLHSSETLSIPEIPSQFDRVIMVSNRAPLKTVKHPDGSTTRERTIGGLGTALLEWGMQSDAEIMWIAWDGEDKEAGGLENAYSSITRGNGVHLVEFPLSGREQREYYETMSNERIWLLFHELNKDYEEGMGPKKDFDMDAWHTYKGVARKKFATEIMNQSQNNKKDMIWIHDYHLMTVAHELRRMGSDQTIAFFLHIPFPPPDQFAKLPFNVRHDLLEGFLANDLVGFQTAGDRDNFLQTVKKMMFHKDIQIESSELGEIINIDGRKIVTQAFPISIDSEGIEQEAKSEKVQEIAAELKGAWGEERQTILHLSRLDPSKGIPETLGTFREAMRYYKDLRDFFHLALVVAPSRLNVQAYRDLNDAQLELIYAINTEYPRAVTYYKGFDREHALAALTQQEIFMALSGKDGMNLAVKEAAMVGPEHGAIIMGQGVGATFELGEHAFVVDPADIIGNAHILYQAHTMPRAQRIERKSAMYNHVKIHHVNRWGNDIARIANAISLAKAAA